jgi:phage terminase large subunit
MTEILARVEMPWAVYNKPYRAYLNDTRRTQIFYGGSASGKSVFLAQRAVRDLMIGGRNYLIVRQVGRTLRGSVFMEMLKVIDTWNCEGLFTVNKSDMLITCQNGYQAIFAGLDDVAKLKSLTPAKGAITDIWVEEATEIERNSLKELTKRQRGGSSKTAKRLTLSFNPIFQTHWIYDEYFASRGWASDQNRLEEGDLLILKTTYKDNAFLTADDIADLENESDLYFYNVYTLGNWGVLGHVIFNNWKVVDMSDKQGGYYLPEEQRTNRKHGLDFGYSSDPAAVPMTHYERGKKRIWIYDEIYETGLTNPQLAEVLKPKIGGDYFIADSSEPKSIAELNSHGLSVGGAKKGKDSVLYGIQWLQQQEILVDVSCINMRNELQTYKWKEDAGGNSLPVPVDRNNHLIDALRYAYEDEMVGAGVILFGA